MPLLDQFLISNSEIISKLKEFSFLFDISESEITPSSSKFYLQLVIERILNKLLYEFEESRKKKIIFQLISFLLSAQHFISLNLPKTHTITQFNLNKTYFIEDIIEIIDEIVQKLKLQAINDDIFGDLYQELIHSDSRHDAGEYYTPKWLVQNIIDDIWGKIENLFQKTKHVRILDPSCGSGIFLIYILNKGINLGIFSTVDDIICSIYGFDINNLSLNMAKANFLLILILNPNLNIIDLTELKINPFRNINTLITINSKKKLENYLEGTMQPDVFNSFDILIGNPPWLTLKSIQNLNYQEVIKNQFFSYKLITKKQTHLFTQLEIASLFYNKSIDLYLKQKGLICFVMPKSVILHTKQNESFQKFLFPKSKLVKIWDLQNIQNLFGMPSCVLFGIKGMNTTYPVDLLIFNGVKTKESGEKKKVLYEITLSNYDSIKKENKISFYFDKFKVGASIFPRNLYFIQINNEKNKFIEIRTDPDINQIAKKQWKNIFIEGIVNKIFLFHTLLAWELLPFGFLSLRLILLPISITKTNQIELIPLENMDDKSRDWFIKANEYWIRNNTEKSKRRFRTLNDRLNYNNLLIKQELRQFIVLYSGTGTNICSCVISRKELSNLYSEKISFIADVKTWLFETDNELEAHYLSAILNSSILNNLIKPLQPQGLGGGRAIHRRPLEFPIGKFDKTNVQHMKLAKISLQAHNIIKAQIQKETIKTRKQGRELIKDELKEINKIVTKLLN